MANPTTNYGFVLPTPTDLVTDLPADFDVALQGVDTQMLTNANAAIAKTIVDAKGDIIAATAADAVSRLAVGANDTVLTADSTTATGLKWAAAATSGPAFKAFLAADSGTLSNGTFTKVALANELFDTNNAFDSTTNYRFTPQTAGYYQLSATAEFNGETSRTFVLIYFNGARYSDLGLVGGGFGNTLGGADLLYFNGSTDYAELYVLSNDAGTSVAGQASPGYRTKFAGVWIRS